MRTGGEVKVALLPARSKSFTEALTAGPSAVRRRGGAGTPPKRLSLTVRGMVTSALYQPAAFGVGEGAPKPGVGGVLSMLMPETVAVAAFPASSTNVCVTDWFAPSLSNLTAAAAVPCTPERESA